MQRDKSWGERDQWMGRQITSNTMGWDPENTRACDSTAMRARERGNAQGS